MYEDFNIWLSLNFIPCVPYFADKEVIAQSPPIINADGYTSFDLVIRYEVLTPDSASAPASYNVYTIIESAYLVGEWTPVHYQFEGINSISDAPFRMMTMTPHYNMPKPDGNSNEIKEGLTKKTMISLISGRLTGAFRIRLVNSDPTGTAPLTAIRATAYGRMFDKPSPPGMP